MNEWVISVMMERIHYSMNEPSKSNPERIIQSKVRAHIEEYSSCAFELAERTVDVASATESKHKTCQIKTRLIFAEPKADDSSYTK